jgi:hypothetical protein
LAHRIQNPIFFNLVKRIAIPYAAKMAGMYYGMKRGGEMENTIWKMATA